MTFNHETSRAHPHPHRGRLAHRVPRRLRVVLGAHTPVLVATALLSLALGLAPPPARAARPASGPRYDVPHGFTRCPDAKAWHGFFKWASAGGTSCREAARFMRAYAGQAGDRMPKAVGGYRCRIFYWRNDDGDIYASRHTCTRNGEVVRFYGMV
jgi:hypothetical protein